MQADFEKCPLRLLRYVNVTKGLHNFASVEIHEQLQLPATLLTPTLTLTVFYSKSLRLEVRVRVTFVEFERVISVHKLAYQAAVCDGKGSILWINTPTKKKRPKGLQ